MSLPDIDRTVGENLRRIRRERGLSLAAAAALCGVSSSMFGQIERGESSPTVATLQKLIGGLQIGYDDLLLSEGEEGARLMDAAQLPVYKERAGKYRLTMLLPYERRRRFAQVYARILPGQVCGRVSEEAYVEYAAVQQGELLLRVGSEEYRLQNGQCARIPRDAAHVYCNHGTEMLTLLITLSYEDV